MSPASAGNRTVGQGKQSKVARVIREYDLEGMGDTLVEDWVGENGNRRSLRELATYLNQQLLRKEIERAEMNPLEGEVENLYRLLTNETASSGSRIEAETKLQRAGIDVESLERDFVSHQAVHTYLTKYRDVERPSAESNSSVDGANGAIQRLSGRLTAVVEKNLRTLRKTDRITLGKFSVLVEVRVFCEDCESQYDIGTLLSNRGCGCKE